MEFYPDEEIISSQEISQDLYCCRIVTAKKLAEKARKVIAIYEETDFDLFNFDPEVELLGLIDEIVLNLSHVTKLTMLMRRKLPRPS